MMKIEADYQTDVASELESGNLEALRNDRISSYKWTACFVEVQDRKSGQAKRILDNITGEAVAGTYA